ncbi:MAG: cell envelope integrity protein TolA, partial [Armatimonadetes bacterium]|nr:cell envelope integrity protein TolA [Armatimonadota bacterium]
DAQAKARAAEAQERAEAEAKAVADAELKAKAKAEADAQAEAKRVAAAKAAAEAQAKRAAEAEEEARRTAEARSKAEAEARKAADAKAKADAEAKRVAQAKAEAEAKARKQAEVAKKLDVGDLRQFLNTKDKNQSTGATGSELQKTASLGTAAGTAAKLNPSLRDALGALIKEQVERCYSVPIGASGGNATIPRLDIRLHADGSLAAEPRVLRAGSSALDRTIAETAARAVRRCAPYSIPARFAPYYEEWKIWHIDFDLGHT